jgi:hypothetical protein
MGNVIRRSVSEPLRVGLSWHELWKGEDRGLIQCWENGRRATSISPDVVSAARRGELPTLDWKGGITGTPKMKKKYGSLCYLATWQGMRDEDLCIDVTQETSVTCSRTGVKVTFTPDLSKLDTDSGENSQTAEAEA